MRSSRFRPARSQRARYERQLLHGQLHGQREALVLDVLGAAGQQDCQGGRDVGRGAEVDEHLLTDVEGLMDLLGDVGVVLDGVAQVHGPVGDVAGLVLHAHPEDALLDVATVR